MPSVTNPILLLFLTVKTYKKNSTKALDFLAHSFLFSPLNSSSILHHTTLQHYSELHIHIFVFLVDISNLTYLKLNSWSPSHPHFYYKICKKDMKVNDLFTRCLLRTKRKCNFTGINNLHQVKLITNHVTDTGWLLIGHSEDTLLLWFSQHSSWS